MRNLNMVLAGALIAGVSLIGAARAAPVGLPDGARAAIDQLNILEAAHMWSGQDYCWYEDGWNGAGWYQCGYAGRKNYGWGGPYGWHGWAAPVWGHRMAYGGSHDDGSWLLLVGHCCCGLAEVAEGLSG